MSIIDDAKEIANLVKKYNDQDLYERIVSLREQILELREDNIKLKEQFKELSKAKDIEDKLVRIGNAYYFKDDSTHKNPYCLACWDHDKKLVSMVFGLHNTIRCKICAAR